VTGCHTFSLDTFLSCKILCNGSVATFDVEIPFRTSPSHVPTSVINISYIFVDTFWRNVVPPSLGPKGSQEESALDTTLPLH
jgi:hypothetical protein